MKEYKDEVMFSKDNSICIKGFAILIIMIGHFMGEFGKGIRVFTPLGGIGVAIFLMLSAYGLNESYEKNGLRYWWRKRIITVFLPYAIVQTLFDFGGGGSILLVI